MNKPRKNNFLDNVSDNSGRATYYIVKNKENSTNENTKNPLKKRSDLKHLKDISYNMIKYNNFKIHPEGKIDAKRVQTFEEVMQRIEENRDNFLIENKELIKRFIYDARLGKTIIGKQKKKIGIKRIVKYIQDLKKLDVYFKKPLDKLTNKDMEKFIVDLEEGKINYVTDLKNLNNVVNKTITKSYAPETQVAIKKVIKKFYKWLWGNNKTFPSIVEWIDTSIEIVDVPTLSKTDIDKLIGFLVSTRAELLIRNKAIFMVLFDSGARAEELLNIRLKHLSYENDNYKIRIEFSKTKQRTLSLPFCKDFLDKWLDIHPAINDPEAQLFPINYNNLFTMIKRAGETLNYKISPHSLRHSSATYWCKYLSRYDLCYRFGWAMSSKMPDRYIDRAGLDQEMVENVIKNTNMEKLQQENQTLNQRVAILEDNLKRLFGADYDEAQKIIELVKQQKV